MCVCVCVCGGGGQGSVKDRLHECGSIRFRDNELCMLCFGRHLIGRCTVVHNIKIIILKDKISLYCIFR